MPRREDKIKDPFGSFNFTLAIGGITVAGFSEVTGLNNETAPIDYREGTDPITPRRLPGLTKNGNVTLKRGVTLETDLWDWRTKVLDGDIERKTVTISLRDEKGKDPRVQWVLHEAWPSKYVGPDMKANASEVAIESLEIVHEKVERVKV
jgi:phage tail-like protein